MDYPNLWGYLRDLYQTPGFGETTNRYHIEHHYQVLSIGARMKNNPLAFSTPALIPQGSHLSINPHGIVAIGPDLDFNLPHDRATRFPA